MQLLFHWAKTAILAQGHLQAWRPGTPLDLKRQRGTVSGLFRLWFSDQKDTLASQDIALKTQKARVLLNFSNEVWPAPG